MSTPNLRLPLDLVWMNTGKGIAVYSSSGAILLEGEDAGLVAEELFPLLDGTRTAAEVVGALPDIDAPDLMNILGSLKENGLLEIHDQLTPVGLHQDERRASLQNAGVLIAGDATWATAAAEALRASGIGHLTTNVEEAAQVDIAAGIFYRTQPEALAHFAGSCMRSEVPFLTCVVSDNDIFLGPLAIPGCTACWNCARLRMIANSQWRETDCCATSSVAEDQGLVSSLLASEICAAVQTQANHSRLNNHLVVLHRNSLQRSIHHVLPVPGCGLCGGPEDGRPTHELAGLDDGFPELAERVMTWFVDPLTGIIKRAAVEPIEATGVELPIVANAIPGDAPCESGPRREMPVGWGKGMCGPAAIISAVGEAMERYAASMPCVSRIVWSRPAGLPGERLDPREFALYSADQYERTDFPFVRFNPEVSHPWVAGKWLGRNDPVWVPAILTYLSYEVRPENLFCQGTSNGLAAGTEPDEAALRAILELLERDAFMRSWRCKRPGQHIKIDQTLDADLLEVVRGIRGFGTDVSLVMLEAACGYPTALCLAFGDGHNWPAVSLGLGADPDPRTAVRQAILELGQTGPYLRRLMRTKAYPAPASPQDVRQMLDHASYYFPRERASIFDYLRDNRNACPLSHLGRGTERSLPACASALESAGIRVALVDVTSEDVRSTPFRVVRAISPDLQPISFGYGLDREAVPRLADCQVPLSAHEISPIW